MKEDDDVDRLLKEAGFSSFRSGKTGVDRPEASDSGMREAGDGTRHSRKPLHHRVGALKHWPPWISILVSSIMLSLAAMSLMLTALIYGERITLTLAVITDGLLQIEKKILQSYASLAKRGEEPPAPKTEPSGPKPPDQIATAPHVEVRPTETSMNAPTAAPSSSSSARRPVQKLTTGATKRPPSSGSIRFVVVFGKGKLNQLLNAHPESRPFFNRLQENHHWLFGSPNAKPVYYVPMPRKGHEDDFQRLARSGLHLIELHVPSSWSQDEMDSHMDRWTANTIGVNRQRIEEWSSVRLPESEEEHSTCSINGVCLILTRSWTPRAFGDFHIWTK